MWAKIKNRIKEPSTWAGLGVLAVLFGVPAEAANAVLGVVNAVVSTGAGPHDVGAVLASVCAAVAVFVPETKK
jgi:hypothetical protein